MASDARPGAHQLFPGVEYVQRIHTLYIVPSEVYREADPKEGVNNWSDAVLWAMRAFLKTGYALDCRYVVLVSGKEARVAKNTG